MINEMQLEIKVNVMISDKKFREIGGFKGKFYHKKALEDFVIRNIFTNNNRRLVSVKGKEVTND